MASDDRDELERLLDRAAGWLVEVRHGLRAGVLAPEDVRSAIGRIETLLDLRSAPAPDAPVAPAPEASALPEEPPDESPESLLLGRIAGLREVLAEVPALLPEGAAAFLDRLPALAQEAADRGQRQKLLYDCVSLLDRLLGAAAYSAGREDLCRVLRPVQSEAAALLEAARDFRFLPPVGADSPAGDVDAEVRKVLSDAPEGTVLRVRRMVVRSDGPAGRPRIDVAWAGTPELRRVFLGAYRGLEQAVVSGVVEREAGEKDAAALSGLIDEIPGADADRVLSLARQVVNVLHPLLPDTRQAPYLKLVLDFLAAQGVRELKVELGRPFDERYSPAKYDRVSVSSSEPAGTVVSLIQRGFVDRSSVALQKAVVGVSRGG